MGEWSNDVSPLFLCPLGNFLLLLFLRVASPVQFGIRWQSLVLLIDYGVVLMLVASMLYGLKGPFLVSHAETRLSRIRYSTQKFGIPLKRRKARRGVWATLGDDYHLCKIKKITTTPTAWTVMKGIRLGDISRWALGTVGEWFLVSEFLYSMLCSCLSLSTDA